MNPQTGEIMITQTEAQEKLAKLTGHTQRLTMSEAETLRRIDQALRPAALAALRGGDAAIAPKKPSPRRFKSRARVSR